jgi:hypothetical protein
VDQESITYSTQKDGSNGQTLTQKNKKMKRLSSFYLQERK